MKRSVKRIGKCFVSGLLIIGLVAGNGAFVQAKKVTKDESVYVMAASDGEVHTITVSDWLKNAGINGTLKDETTLESIENIKGDETFEQEGKGLNWNAGASDIYYQGTTEKELPVSVKLSYQLDGEEISPEDLVGKSGEVTIQVSYENHLKKIKTVDGKQQEMYTPFLMATGLILPTEKFTEVEIDGGKIINEGTNQIVIGFGVPGMAKSLDVSGEIAEKFRESFEVNARVEDFSMGNTITYASASILSDLNVEDDDTFDDLAEDIEKLVDSSGELREGSDTLSEKMKELSSKFKTYAKGEKTLNQGIDTLNRNGKKLVSGVKEYTTGVESAAKGITDYVNGAGQIVEGNKQLYEAVKNMPATYQEFSSAICQYTTGVDKLANKETADALKSGASSVANGISTLNKNLSALEKSYNQYELLIQAIEAEAAQLSDESQKQTLFAYARQLKELSAGQKASVSSLVTATEETSELKSGANQVSGGISQILDGAAALSKNSPTLRAADTQMTGSVKALVENVEKLKNGGEKLSQNERKLLTGAKKLRKSSKTIRSGSKELTEGAAKLKKGSNKLHRSTSKLTKGIDALDDGASELSKGMKKIDDEGIQKINEMYETDFVNLKDRLSTLLDLSKEYTNFSGIGDGMDGAVKFIIETEELGTDEDE